MSKALIYCRVSTDKQVREGHGLDSQEKRCREHAERKGYTVEKAFCDDGVSGGLFERPAMKELIAYLDQNKKKEYIIIFDDLSRFARDVKVHLQMRTELSGRGAKLECLNFNFEDTPEGQFIELILAGKAQLDREQNKRQVISRMQMRFKQGYWTFCAPLGYKFTKDATGNKVCISESPMAEIVTEALEGFASGRFVTQRDVADFMEGKGYESKFKKRNEVHLEAVKRFLTNEFYAGWIVCKKWDLRVRGVHEPLISSETFQRIQDRLHGIVRTHVRTDIREEFPLRGNVFCTNCGRKFTASWSTGRNKKYPFYRCLTPRCTGSIPKKTFEKEFQKVLRKGQPTKEVVKVFETVLKRTY